MRKPLYLSLYILFCVAILSIGIGIGCELNPIETKFVLQAIEIPIIKVIQLPPITTIKVVEKPVWKIREFESLSDLSFWLRNNPVSEHEYIPEEYDCDDFVIDLIIDAAEDGYLMGLYTIHHKSKNKGHMMCCTIIGNKVVLIEPQNDAYQVILKRDKKALRR